MRKDLLPLRGVLLLVDEAPLFQAFELLQARLRRHRGGGRLDLGTLLGFGRRLAPDVIAKAVRRGERERRRPRRGFRRDARLRPRPGTWSRRGRRRRAPPPG